MYYTISFIDPFYGNVPTYSSQCAYRGYHGRFRIIVPSYGVFLDEMSRQDFLSYHLMVSSLAESITKVVSLSRG